jgi:hypothetical protein
LSFPWDPENIAPNLQTLSNLHRGDHLSVLKDGENTGEGTYTLNGRGLRARFQIEKKMKQAFVRSKKGETILDDEQYLYPLIRFFRAAFGAWGRKQVSSDLVMAGFHGLETLQRTYAGDQSRKAKMAEIVQVVRQQLRGILVEGIYLEQGESNLILGEQEWPGMRQWIMEKLSESNEGLREEYSEGVDQEFINKVFGPEAEPKPPTFVPMGNFAYKRHAMGVCRQFRRDAHLGKSMVSLGGLAVTCSSESLARLYEFVIRDEGLLFAVSQLSSQSGVACLSTYVLNQGGLDGQKRVPLIQFGFERLLPSIGKGESHISKLSDAILVKSKIDIPGSVQTPTTDGSDHPLRYYGVASISAEFAVTLERKGNRIEMQLYQATLRIVTVPPSVED